MNAFPPFSPQDEASRILAAVVESSDAAIVAKDLNGIIVLWSRGAERIYGFTADEVKGRPISLLIPEDRRSEFSTILERIRAGQPVERYETVRQTKAGRRVDVSLVVSLIENSAGQVVGAVAVASDITARQHAEAAQRESEARWRSVVESAVDAIVVIDARGRIDAFNPAAERMFGYAEAEVVGRNVNLLMPEPYHHEHDGYLSRYLSTGVPRIIGIGREITGRRRDGSTFPAHLAVGEMTVNGERRFTGFLHDLSARVRMEEQMREQAALARLGEMAAVIAHEVKNPLAGVRGAIQVIGSRLPPQSKDAAIVTEIIARIDGLNSLMKDLLLFARPPQPHPAPVDVAALVTLTADLLTADPAVGRVRVEVEGTVPPVMADAELLKIVFLNLLVNGAHAMQGQGVIRVALSSADEMCQVAFRDSGPGIPANIREQVFTPFFTTKARGSGLGLPTAKQLVDAHAGRINIECPSAGGTVVTVYLPLPAPPLPQAQQSLQA